MEENKDHKHNNSENENTMHRNERVYSRGVDRLRTKERVEMMEVERVIKLSLAEDIKSVLDIGTGSALFAEGFSNVGINVTGIDTNPEMIKAAKQFVLSGKFQEAPAEKIPFDDNTFDLTFFGVVFHEVDDYLKALKEAFRVSKAGTSILEWDYKHEDFGPPLEHRLKPDFIKKLSEDTGYKNFQVIKLNKLVLYKLTK
jgi:ubiquinone/menaquinone biosynthesis C-methylase UbiE